MSNRNKFRHLNFSALFLASSIFLIFSFNCFASDIDPSMQKYIEKFINLEITQKDGVKYFDNAKFWEKEGIYIVYLEGAPFEMGYQQGKLLKESIRTNVKYSNTEIEKLGNPESTQRILKNIEKALPQEFIEEIKGIAAGSEVLYDDIFRHNFWGILYGLQYLCSNFAVFNEATVDKKLIHFNTFDWTWIPSFIVLQIRRPSTGNGFVTYSEAGSIHAISGLNEKGISAGHTGIHYTAKEYYSDEGLGKFMLLRKILQYADTMDDVEKILNMNKMMGPPGTYLVAHGKAKEGKVFELTSKGFKWRPPKNNFLGSTNHFTLWSEPIGKGRNESEDRLRLMERFCKKNYGKIDLSNTISFLREPRIAKMNPEYGSITRDMMLFVPENLDFWVAGAKEKNVPASWGSIVGFNLLKELGKADSQLPDPVTFPPGKK